MLNSKYLQEVKDHFFVRINGPWWWLWMFGINGIQIFILHPIFKNCFHLNPIQHCQFSKQFEVWYGNKFLSIWCHLLLYPPQMRIQHLDIATPLITILIPSEIIFAAVEDTIPSSYLDKLIGVFLIWVVDSLTYALLLQSPVYIG